MRPPGLPTPSSPASLAHARLPNEQLVRARRCTGSTAARRVNSNCDGTRQRLFPLSQTCLGLPAEREAHHCASPASIAQAGLARSCFDGFAAALRAGAAQDAACAFRLWGALGAQPAAPQQPLPPSPGSPAAPWLARRWHQPRSFVRRSPSNGGSGNGVESGRLRAPRRRQPGARRGPGRQGA